PVEAAARKCTSAPPGYFIVRVTPAVKNRSAASPSTSSGRDDRDVPDRAARVSADAAGKSRGNATAGRSGEILNGSGWMFQSREWPLVRTECGEWAVRSW